MTYSTSDRFLRIIFFLDILLQFHPLSHSTDTFIAYFTADLSCDPLSL